MNENQQLEYKQVWKDDWLKTICAFANAHGGRLVIGCDDEGRVVGLKNINKLLEDIPNKVRDVLGVMVDVNLCADSRSLEVCVDPYPNPISCKGEYFYRSGSTTQSLKGAALERFLLKKRGIHWDGTSVPGVSIKKLSAEALQIFRDRSAESRRMPAADLSLTDKPLLEKLKLTADGEVKRAAILLFYPDPEQFVTGAFVKIGFFRSGTDLRFQDEVHGSLFTQVDKVLDLLLTKYTEATISYRGVQRIERSPVPEDALREALHNAVVHRDYSIPSPIQIRVYVDRICIWNPGQLPPEWNVGKLMDKHASYPFNPDIANVFFRAGMVEAWGRGIEKILESCAAVGNPQPEIRCEQGDFWIEFPFMSQREEDTQLSAGTSGKRRESVGKTSGKILEACRENSSVTIPELAGRIGVTERSIERNLRNLQKLKLLKRIGGRKEGRWQVLDEKF